ncbi:MAG: hypothetical protein ACLQUW_13220 [Desulfobaccales bacterium]
MASESKRELLRAKVVDLVKEFAKTEGGITPGDLNALFGPISPVMGNEIATCLAMLPVSIL